MEKAYVFGVCFDIYITPALTVCATRRTDRFIANYIVETAAEVDAVGNLTPQTLPLSKIISFLGNLCTETPQVTVEGEESSSDSSSSSSSSSSAEEDDHSASASSSAAAATKVKKKKNSRKTGSKKGGRRKKRVCLSESHVSSHRSAIKWWHAENKMPLPPDFESEIKQLMVGYKKKIAGLKQSGKMPQQEGKVALKFG